MRALACGLVLASCSLSTSAPAARAQTPSEMHAREALRAGWESFLLDRPEAAIASFARAIDLAPFEHPMRDEALQMLGGIFADRDWDRDGREDSVGVRTRLEDARLVAPDRPWIAALYFATARGLHLTSRDADAIALIDHALARWPAPERGTVLQAACDRHRARQATASLQATLPEIDAICARRAPP